MHSIQIHESDTTFIGGQVTTYQLNEESRIFYEIKHAKPIAGYGSKLRIYSKATGTLSIKVKVRWVGSPVIKSNIELSDKLQKLLKELSSKIGSFTWAIEPHHLGWPSELKNSTVLNFECDQIDSASAMLESIRLIHIELLESKSV
jgi:hypothetical protein